MIFSHPNNQQPTTNIYHPPAVFHSPSVAHILFILQPASKYSPSPSPSPPTANPQSVPTAFHQLPVMQWLTILAIPLVVISAWLYTVSIAHARFPRLRNKRICLLIAHPDDEAMFFAPTLLALTEPALGNHVKILCLSSGDSDGLGETRKKELVKSGMALGLRNEDDVFVVESPYAPFQPPYFGTSLTHLRREFPDSITTAWDKQKIAMLLSSAFAPNLSNPMKNKSADAPTATIDVLITFDASGVSSHPNHISLFHGARHFIASLIRNRPGWGCPVDLYSLSSVNMARKYSSVLDSVISVLVMAVGEKLTREQPSPLLFLSGIQEVRRAQSAMTTAHQSQMRWFRWGWIGLSRYMVVNDLRLEEIAAS
ncbi:N-acetylglucosaminyl-phosphatidylinositol de-N-acetylase [Marssonina coronariae]|uniref:N-acetylglucosaminylphosphatidylinositol deacetylase n=1 Tax=Diplocarpon coronariae TaxID=2795749 RepID=A0A218YTX7_9HELO|nr:N-acetylglucosaminyl-phosphatidylinositol de-N-acetylase [Marssonina coronariae]